MQKKQLGGIRYRIWIDRQPDPGYILQPNFVFLLCVPHFTNGGPRFHKARSISGLPFTHQSILWWGSCLNIVHQLLQDFVFLIFFLCCLVANSFFQCSAVKTLYLTYVYIGLKSSAQIANWSILSFKTELVLDLYIFNNIYPIYPHFLLIIYLIILI